MARHEIVASFWEEPVGPPVGYVRHRRGAVVDVPDEHVERLLRLGAIVPVEPVAPAEPRDDEATGDQPPVGDSASDTVSGDASADANGVPASAGDAPDDQTATVPVERPKQTASKAVWVEYAVARGIDRDAAEDTEKRDLIDAIDALS